MNMIDFGTPEVVLVIGFIVGLAVVVYVGRLVYKNFFSKQQ